MGLFISLRGPGEPSLSLRVFILEKNILILSLVIPLASPNGAPLLLYRSVLQPLQMLGRGVIFPHRFLFPSPSSFLILFFNLKICTHLSASLIPTTIVMEDFDKAVISKASRLPLWPSTPILESWAFQTWVNTMGDQILVWGPGPATEPVHDQRSVVNVVKVPISLGFAG